MLVRAAALSCLAMAWAPAAAAQARPIPGATFLTRADFSFSWARLASIDRRFAWEGRIGIDIDLVTYATGRVNLTADYDAVLGHERRPFDLNHGNYFFEATASRQLRWLELAGVARHASRHLNDRENPQAISWNLIGVRAWRDFKIRESTVQARLEAGRAMQQAFVDYRWTSDLQLAFRRPVKPSVEAFATANGGVIIVDSRIAGRDRQCGGRVEGGLRINGAAGALEVFAGYERRMDAYPLDRGRVRWFTVGFRLKSGR